MGQGHPNRPRNTIISHEIRFHKLYCWVYLVSVRGKPCTRNMETHCRRAVSWRPQSTPILQQRLHLGKAAFQYCRSVLLDTTSDTPRWGQRTFLLKGLVFLKAHLNFRGRHLRDIVHTAVLHGLVRTDLSAVFLVQ